MEIKAQRRATPEQLAYIQHLRNKQGKESLEIDEELGFEDASKMIRELTEGSQIGELTKSVKINEARLGMIFKCGYRNWVTSGEDIFRNKNVFIKNVLDSYALVNDIAQELSAQTEA